MAEMKPWQTPIIKVPNKGEKEEGTKREDQSPSLKDRIQNRSQKGQRNESCSKDLTRSIFEKGMDRKSERELSLEEPSLAMTMCFTTNMAWVLCKAIDTFSLKKACKTINKRPLVPFIDYAMWTHWWKNWVSKWCNATSMGSWHQLENYHWLQRTLNILSSCYLVSIFELNCNNKL